MGRALLADPYLPHMQDWTHKRFDFKKSFS